MNARDLEQQWLDRCVAVGTGAGHEARDAVEVHQFRTAAALVRSTFPAAAAQLHHAQAAWFARHPNAPVLATAEAVRLGWLSSLPRLRDMLSQRLARHTVHGHG